MRDRQEKSNVVQGVPAQKMPGRGHVEEWFALRPTVQLVQNPLSAPTAATAAAAAEASASMRRSPKRRRLWWLDVQAVASAAATSSRSSVSARTHGSDAVVFRFRA